MMVSIGIEDGNVKVEVRKIEDKVFFSIRAGIITVELTEFLWIAAPHKAVYLKISDEEKQSLKELLSECIKKEYLDAVEELIQELRGDRNE